MSSRGYIKQSGLIVGTEGIDTFIHIPTHSWPIDLISYRHRCTYTPTLHMTPVPRGTKNVKYKTLSCVHGCLITLAALYSIIAFNRCESGWMHALLGVVLNILLYYSSLWLLCTANTTVISKRCPFIIAIITIVTIIIKLKDWGGRFERYKKLYNKY